MAKKAKKDVAISVVPRNTLQALPCEEIFEKLLAACGREVVHVCSVLAAKLEGREWSPSEALAVIRQTFDEICSRLEQSLVDDLVGKSVNALFVPVEA